MRIDRRITGKTKILGVLGNPIEHTFSPQLHNTISKYLKVDAVYIPFKVERQDLQDAVKGLKALNVAGFNVTIPYKKEIMKYIDENSREALIMGAVNTVKNIDGRFYGYNTDGEGFARAFKEETGTDFKGKDVVILGAGGAARAIATKVAIEGAKNIHIINRTPERAQEIAELINNNIRRIVDAYDSKDDAAVEVFRKSDVIVNTVPLGMYPDTDAVPVDERYDFSGHQVVYDTIYNPPKTRFLSLAEKKGCKTVNGLGMLFYQGIFAYEIWTGIKLGHDFVMEVFKAFAGLLTR